MSINSKAFGIWLLSFDKSRLVGRMGAVGKHAAFEAK
jgi:hypothetical protein